MIKEPRINLLELAVCLSEAVDLISPVVSNHHKQVAYISYSLAYELGLPELQQNKVAIAGALHDIGAVTLKERIQALEFETESNSQHAETGYRLLSLMEPLHDIALIVRYHHCHYNKTNSNVPKLSHILHLADRISVLINNKKDILSQVSTITKIIDNYSGTLFDPELVKIFNKLAQREYFWLDVVSNSLGRILGDRLKVTALDMEFEDLIDFSKIFSTIIDFRNPTNANHSAGVAGTAEMLSSIVGFSARESRMMCMAGYLHDLGKLAIPVDILEKPGKLTESEFTTIKSHTYYTHRILDKISDLQVINAWASFHHERLDGTGYPFHLKEKDLPLGSQIMAVADIFTAISENRPYRAGMNKDEVTNVLNVMADKKAINGNLVTILLNNYQEINNCRISAQQKSGIIFKK